MTRLEKAEALLAGMSPAEKAQLLQKVVQDLGDAFPSIDHDPAVAGGEARVVRTRIPVWVLVQARRQGLSDARILASYPSLRAEDLVSAWAYARVHPDEIERQISDNEAA